MQEHEKADHSGAAGSRTAARKPAAATSAASAQLRDLLGLPAGAGNGAVVQMLRKAGHPWAQEQHEHSAGCGHQENEQRLGPAEQPAVQRSAVHDVLRTSGRPLDDDTRTDMEARLGADFSDVRIHNDAAAKASAAEVGARAYTSGHHVVLGDGGGDRHTLAHELTHVIQQRQGPVAGTDTGNGLKVSDPSDRFEREAEANAGRALAADPQAAPNLQRQVAPPSHPSAPLPSVQRVYDHENPENPQNVMTTEHWERQAGVVGQDGKATPAMVKTKAELMAAAKPPKKGKGKAKSSKASPGRTMDEIIQRVGPDLLRQLQAKSPTSGKLELFRAMSVGEARSALEYWGSTAQIDALQYVADDGGSSKEFKTNHKGMTVGAHLGDKGQAESYHNMEGDAYQVLLKFTLKPGAHELLFDPEYMALGPSYKSELIRKANGGEYQNANPNEGTLPGYLGVKPEENEPFSVAVAQGANGKRGREVGPSQLLFQLFVENVSLVTNKSGTPLPGETAAAGAALAV